MSHPTHTPLSKERIEEIKALRDHVRQSLPLAMTGAAGKNVVNFLRVEALLDESELLQNDLDHRQEQTRQVLQGLLYSPNVLAQLDPCDQVRCSLRNNEIRAAAQQLGLTLD